MVSPKLNPQQQAAVEHIDGPLLVLAGAGSGKTGVITHKVAHLIDSGVPPGRIAAVTFTNKAAREMKARVGGLLDADNIRGLLICTFHSLGLRLLQSETEAAGLKPGFSIFDADDSDKLLADLLGKDPALRKIARSAISRWKAAGIEHDRALADVENDGEARLARAYAEYQRHLRAYNAVDFDDLLALPVTLLRDNAQLRERWQNRFRYLLVDEYQDTNGAQYQLLKLLAGVRAAFTVVGDDDQSIYAWRGAQPGNIGDLNKDFPHLTVVKLEQNYRSCGHILTAANHLIENNERAYAKTLWSAFGAGDRLRILPCPDDNSEAERVVSELIAHRIRGGQRYGDYAILYRGNYQARAFERALRERSIAYRVSGGQSFFDRSEIRDLMAYLRLLVNSDDDTAFLRIVNLPRRELGPATLEQLGRYAGERNLSLFDAAKGIGLAGALSGRAAHRLDQFVDWIQGLMMLNESEAPAQILDTLMTDISYSDWLRESTPNERQAKRKLDNVQEFAQWLQRVSEPEKNRSRTLQEVVAHLGLMDMLDKQDEGPDPNQVHLLTLHAAKGLEFDHVFLTGVEEGLLPHHNSLAEDNLEEERRLMYVGITRARKSLALSYCKQRKRQGKPVDCEPSRFLTELPPDVIEWEGKSSSPPEQVQQRGREHLAGLKSMLSSANS